MFLFHVFVKSKSIKSVIFPLKIGEDKIEVVFENRQAVVNCVSNHFKEPLVDRLYLDGVTFRPLSDKHDNETEQIQDLPSSYPNSNSS